MIFEEAEDMPPKSSSMMDDNSGLPEIEEEDEEEFQSNQKVARTYRNVNEPEVSNFDEKKPYRPEY